MSFVDQLLLKGVVSEATLPELVRLSNEKFDGNIERALLQNGVSDDQILEVKKGYFNMPVRRVDPKTVTFDILKYIPQESAKYYSIVPLSVSGGSLEVGVVDPENIQATDAVQFITSKLNMPYTISVISYGDFEKIVLNYKGLTQEVDRAVSEMDDEIGQVDTSGIVVDETNPQAKLTIGEEERIVEDAPIIKIVAVIIRHAIEGNASDIHIENTGEQVKVRFRVDGVLHTSLVLPMNVYAGIVARIKILSKLRLDEKRKPQDGGFSTRIKELANRKIDFRVSTFPTSYGEKVVMRILDSERGVKDLEALNLSPGNLALIKEAINRPYGLILITGPTGSGKSTTLYSMLNNLDREKSNAVSLEDPVEYHMANMNQSQVMPEIGYTFASGLRSILRQDPDIIMVGEIRDKETAELAIQAALTGHLVLSTLHTNSALGAIPRLVDMGIDPYLIAPTLILTMGQRLARVICPNSKKEVPIDESMKMMVDRQFADYPEEYKSKLPITNSFYEAEASSDCPSGTRGRMAVFEAIKIDQEMQKMILTNPVEPELYKIARSKGFLTMREDALLKCMKGSIPFQEIYNF
jgi:type IV pilus assembly protein PilB